MSDEKMTPGEAFAAIVTVFGINGCNVGDLDPGVRAHLPALAARGFVFVQGGSVKPDLDRLADIVRAGVRAIIDGGTDAR